MIALAALALAVVDPPQSWGGTPFWVSDDAKSAHVRTVLQSVEIRLDPKSVTYRPKALFKNTGDKPVTGVVHVPVLGLGGSDDAFFRTKVRGWWGGAEVPELPHIVDDWSSEGSWANAKGFAVRLGAGEWKGFECAYSRPLDKLGEGLAERTVGYDVLRQVDTLEQFQIAVKYPKGFVFQVIDTLPKKGWQIGESGAFWQAKDLKPAPLRFRLHFYPGTFEGTGG